MLVIGISGLGISSWLGLYLERYRTWRLMQIISRVLTLLLLVVKLIVHWRWIASGARSLVGVSHHPAPSHARIRQERRDFLAVASVATAAYVLAIVGVIRNDPGARSAEADESMTDGAPAISDAVSVPEEADEPAKPAESAGPIEAMTTTASPAPQHDDGEEPSSCTVRCR